MTTSGELGTGSHPMTFTPPDIADAETDYFLVAKVDATGTNLEANEANNTRPFAGGVFQAGTIVYVHGQKMQLRNWSPCIKRSIGVVLVCAVGLITLITYEVVASRSPVIKMDGKFSATVIDVTAVTRSNKIIRYRVNDPGLVREVAAIFQKTGEGGLGDARKADFVLSFLCSEAVVGTVFVVDTRDSERLLYWSEKGTEGVWGLSEAAIQRLKDILQFKEEAAVEPEEIL